jgi:hypothetical protein
LDVSVLSPDGRLCFLSSSSCSSYLFLNMAVQAMEQELAQVHTYTKDQFLQVTNDPDYQAVI